jgi:hypothetical protein
MSESGVTPPAPVGRRETIGRLVRSAGLTPAVLAFLEGRAQALPRGEETDLAVLEAAIVLEHQAIAVYDLGLRHGLFPPGVRRFAVEFRGDHLGHRDTQKALVLERSGHITMAPRAEETPVADGDEMVRLALAIEIAAQQAYSALITQIRSDDYLLSAAFILVDEVRHMTVWRRVLGLKIY